MIDSCRPRKDEPGFAATYSKPRDLMTSIMKSEPGRSTVYTPTLGGGGPVSDATWLGEGVGATRRVSAPCASMIGGLTTSAAAAAAPFRNPLRPTARAFDLAMA